MAGEDPQQSEDLVAHGVPGTEGVPSARIDREFDETALSNPFWLHRPPRTTDIHAAFVTEIDVDSAGEYLLAVQASASFAVWLDGDPIVEGPLRYVPAMPEFHEQSIHLSTGHHRLAVHAHGEGLTTRRTAPLPNFMWVRLSTRNGEVPLMWRGRHLHEYEQTKIRTSPLQGWLESIPVAWKEDWRNEDTRGTDWNEVGTVPALSDVLGTPTRTDAPLATSTVTAIVPMAAGRYRDSYTGYRLDDPTVQFMLADCDPPRDDDADGVWTRYDLGRVRIGRLAVTVRCTSPATVTVCYAEKLAPDGRPSPAVALSTGPTHMLQYIAVDAGTTRIEPFQSLGGRYIEVRVRSSAPVKIVDAEFLERDSLGGPTGLFACSDLRLNRIWQIGIDTLRSAAEDALVDSVRERAEWVGDVVSSALNLLAAGWGDYRLVRRALLHAAAAARPDGLVAGCGPGELIYLGTYAAQWTSACVRTAELEGSLEVLVQFEDVARANLRAIVKLIAPDGTHNLPWCFVDWGYSASPDRPDVAVLCHVLSAIRAWCRWLTLLKRGQERPEWETVANWLENLIRQQPGDGYHALVLAEHAGLRRAEDVASAVVWNLRSGFPFNQSAARLRDPLQVQSGAVTPYFTNYSVATLLRAGHGREVADLWADGWGWMLDRGATTWWEVFDDRWSHCHYWSGAPTWQLSQFVLGVHPTLDATGPAVSLRVNDVGVESASGRVPIPGGGWADVQWSHRLPNLLDYELRLDRETPVDVDSNRRLLPSGSHHFTLEKRLGDLYW